MPADNEQLEPTPFDVAPAPSTSDSPKNTPPGWVWPALGGLMLLALLVVFWLPSLVSPPSATPEPRDGTGEPMASESAARKPGGTPSGPEASPWSDAQAAKLRKEAEQMGLDPNIWFRNVEVVAAKRIGRETVQYVSNIFKYYVSYKLLEDKILSEAEGPAHLSGPSKKKKK